MSKEAEWIQIGKAAKYLGVSRDTLRRWEKKGKITVVRSPSDRRYYTKKQLDQLMEGNGNKEKSSFQKQTKKPKTNKKLSPIIIGAISFTIAALIAFLLQVFLL